MAVQPPKVLNIDVDVPLEAFGGLVTELTPADIPQGASPFAQDVDYQLGAVFTRAGLTSQLANAVAPNPFGVQTINYLKTFTLPSTNDELLILDGSGNFYFEDTTSAPGSFTAIGAVTAGSFLNSVTQFGREFLAFNDGSWGFDAPRQWDGTFFDRVSQDGPGAAPAVTNEIFNPTIASASQPAAVNIVASPGGASESGFLVTVTTTVPHGLIAGQNVIVAGVGVAGYNNGGANPAVFSVISVPTPTTFTYALGTQGLAASGNGTASSCIATYTTPTPHGVAVGFSITITTIVPAGYNVVAQPIYQVPSNVTFTLDLGVAGLAAGGAGTSTIVGNITAGVHKIVQIFLTREGYLTAPSPIGSWTAAGANRGVVTGLAIGPANVVARWLAFTSAGGGFFFVIPIPVAGSSTGTVVADNASISFVVDFTDVALLNAFSIDSPGNNLFNLVVLGPAAGVISYSNRMFWWGERNKIQNLLNMGFDGGFDSTNTFPLGWTVSASSGGGGSRVTPSQITGFAYKMLSAGVAGTHYGSIEQSIFQDSFSVAILGGRTAYTARVAAVAAGVANPGGSLVFELFSATAGLLATATIPINSLTIGTTKYFTANFSANTPAVIPSDALLRTYIINTLNGTSVTIDELEIFPTNVPYISTSLRGSYNSNAESFDGVTGRIGVSNLDGQAIKACFQLRDILYVVKDGSLYATQDNGSTEPFGWTVSTISKAVGTCSIRGIAVAEEYAFIVNQLGVYMFNGSEPVRVNQEIKPVSGLGQGWDSINWQFGSTIWVTLDINNRHLLIGAPTGNSQVPNQIFMMNYRELDESYAVANQKAVHMSYTGKMVSWDMSRKWAQWTISANCAAIIRRQNLSLQVWFGNNTGTGKVYQLDPTNGTDDGAAIQSQYWTFFFVNREMEQGLQVGSHRHLYTYLAAFTSGVGILSLTAVADSLTSTRTKALAPRSLATNPSYDIEAGINFSGDRVAFKFATDGQAGSTFFLSKLTVTMKSDPWAPVRGRV